MDPVLVYGFLSKKNCKCKKNGWFTSVRLSLVTVSRLSGSLARRACTGCGVSSVKSSVRGVGRRAHEIHTRATVGL